MDYGGKEQIATDAESPELTENLVLIRASPVNLFVLFYDGRLE